MRENETAAGQIPAGAAWESWLLALTEGLREMLRTAEVFAGFAGDAVSAVLRPVPVDGLLAEQMETVRDVPVFMEGGEAVLYPAGTDSGNRQGRSGRTPYETARELQRQSELLLRT